MQDLSQVVFGAGNHIIQALPPQRTDKPLAQGIRLRALWRRFEHTYPQVTDALVKLLRENTVAVMEQETVGVVGGHRFAQLLECPGSSGMGRHIDVEDTPRRVFHEHEDIQETKGRRHDDAEITGHDGLGMIAHKGLPALGCGSFAWPMLPALGHVFPHRAWRYPQTQL